MARVVGPFITKAPWLRKVRNDAKGYGKRVRKEIRRHGPMWLAVLQAFGKSNLKMKAIKAGLGKIMRETKAFKIPDEMHEKWIQSMSSIFFEQGKHFNRALNQGLQWAQELAAGNATWESDDQAKTNEECAATQVDVETQPILVDTQSQDLDHPSEDADDDGSENEVKTQTEEEEGEDQEDEEEEEEEEEEQEAEPEETIPATQVVQQEIPATQVVQQEIRVKQDAYEEGDPWIVSWHAESHNACRQKLTDGTTEFALELRIPEEGLDGDPMEAVWPGGDVTDLLDYTVEDHMNHLQVQQHVAPAQNPIYQTFVKKCGEEIKIRKRNLAGSRGGETIIVITEGKGQLAQLKVERDLPEDQAVKIMKEVGALYYEEKIAKTELRLTKDKMALEYKQAQRLQTAAAEGEGAENEEEQPKRRRKSSKAPPIETEKPKTASAKGPAKAKAKPKSSPAAPEASSSAREPPTSLPKTEGATSPNAKIVRSFSAIFVEEEMNQKW